MESLALRDSRPFRRASADERLREPRFHRQSPRLPTPEASRCSNQTLDGPSSEDRCSPYSDRVSLRAVNDIGSPKCDLGAANSMTQDQREYARAQDLPHWLTNARRPTLPPIQTVFGDTISSPPRTPSPQPPIPQASPQEPHVAFSTYKPPALYPSKKQKRNSPVASFLNDPNAHRLARFYLPPPGTEPKPHSSRSADRKSTAATSYRRDDALTRHPTLQPLDNVDLGSASAWESEASTSTMQTTPLSAQPSVNSLGRPHRSPEQIKSASDLDSMRSRSHPRYRVPHSQAAMRFHRPSNDPTTSHHLPSRQYEGFPSTPRDERYVHRSPLTFDPSHPNLLRDRRAQPYDYPSSDGTTPSLSHPATSEDPYCDQGERSDAFASSCYDYPYGKSRKRSNLPKQSTEIMKNWFDQNLGNPYPSEEQKAIFSSATGISMTQVSNWFINHRRRCPELRDRRDKTRPSGRDLGM